jgi:hypothetical protein
MKTIFKSAWTLSLIFQVITISGYSQQFLDIGLTVETGLKTDKIEGKASNMWQMHF